MAETKEEAKVETTYSPGMIVEVRDEHWLVTDASVAAGSQRIHVRGISEYVRDEEAIFFDCFDKIKIIDPKNVTLSPDTSPNFRKSRLWMETTLRQTPVPLESHELVVANSMLVDPLDYQRKAVSQILSADNYQPRLLIADAVGLGKTIEIGLILAELIKRGRGDRILIVTPPSVLEQMQKEMWNRFAIPFVRLDSIAIQRIRQELPATRNPFTYYNRAIVSLDTLKQPKYRTYLEKVNWDAVVVDEAHNVVNRETQNNQLVRMLSTRTDALIFASATPHNGNQKAFGEMLRLLDPAAVDEHGIPIKEFVKKLVIRRHRYSPEVRDHVADQWAERAEPVNMLVEPSAEEAAVARELRNTWTGKDVMPPSAKNEARGHNHLFPWVLLKAFLSSPAALDVTINNRLNLLRKEKHLPETDPEIVALLRLEELNSKVNTSNSAKFQKLISYLKEIGIGPKSDERVVIFSERVDTLSWLKENIAKTLKLKASQITTMNGKDDDATQMAIIESFKRKEDDLRVLVTGDVASEGVNLHQQCHHLIHWDIPWSLIRIQQRNGRIDRYGQHHSPVIATLLLDTNAADSPGDLHIFEKLMEREYTVREQLGGDVAVLMGKYDVKAEEASIRDALSGQKTFEEVVPEVEEALARTAAPFRQIIENSNAPEDSEDSSMAALNTLDLLNFDAPDTQAASESANSEEDAFSSIYATEVEYLQDALLEAFQDHPEKPLDNDGVGWAQNAAEHVVRLNPSPDLQQRFRVLPKDYVKDLHILDEIRLTDNRETGNESIQSALDSEVKANWPRIHYLGPLHPVTAWAADRALTTMGGKEIPIIHGDVESPTIILLATLSNPYGQTITRAIYTAKYEGKTADGQLFFSYLPESDITRWLRDHTDLCDTRAANNLREFSDEDIKELQSLIRPAVEQMNDIMQMIKNKFTDVQTAAIQRFNQSHRRERVKDATERKKYEERMTTKFDPKNKYERPILMVVPKN
ncbi:MAG: helicase-related protein [Corynebacterium sp.]|nr:helicase-related protein [Corynebacterium sp.]